MVIRRAAAAGGAASSGGEFAAPGAAAPLPSPGSRRRSRDRDESSESDESSSSSASGEGTGFSSSSGEEEEDSLSERRSRDQQKKKLRSSCFLCDYCNSPEVKFVSTFVVDNIAHMELENMARQIRMHLIKMRPQSARQCGGLEIADIKRHIRQHMLSPTVRIADMMRHMLKLCESLRKSLGDEGGERVREDAYADDQGGFDRSSIDTYLKVVTKVLDMYKMSETSKMLFGNTENRT